ncbi:outer membrane protein assembly factor BamA [Thermosulfuriphilus sp.]
MARVGIILLVLGVILFSKGAQGAIGPSISLLVLPPKIYSPKPQPKLKEELYRLLLRRLTEEGLRVVSPSKIKEILGEIPEEVPYDRLQKMAESFRVDAVVWGSATEFAGKLSLDLKVFRQDYPVPLKTIYVIGTPLALVDLARQAAKDLANVVLERRKVVEVEILGCQTLDPDAVRALIKIRIGDTYDPEVIREDIKNIFAMGYFDDVRVDVEEKDGGLLVTYILKEKPTVRKIVIEGNKAISDEKLMEILGLKTHTIFNPKEIREAEEKIKYIYREKGYYDTRVSSEVRPSGPQGVEVVFKVKEGEKIYIKEIRFEGNRAFKDSELKDILEISEKDWLSWLKKAKAIFTGGTVEPGVLAWGTLRRDLGKIVSFYHNHGYIDARVGEPKVVQKGRWIYITIPVEEGPQYGVGKIDIQEDLFKDKKFLLSKLFITKEKVFNREALRRDVLRLTDLYADKGYAYAEVEPEIKKDSERLKVDVIFKVDKGPRVRINRIEITGNTRTRDKVIRRELLVQEQEFFSATAIRKSNDRLRRLGYFEDVSISPEKGIREDEMNLDVKVKERPTGSFSIGAGYSSVDNVIVMGEISQRNFLGKGQILSFRGILGGRTNRYTFSFTEPYFRDTKLSVGMDLYNWERTYDDYTKDSTGGALRFGYLLNPDTRIYWGYRYDNTTLKDVSYWASWAIKESEDINITSALNIGLTRDTRNNFFDPTRGTINTISLEYAGGPLGGDSAFVKVQYTWGIYLPFVWGTTFHVRGGLGYVTEGPGGKLPIYEKFYLGGLESVRGFQYGDISPVDPVTGERIGGERMAFVQIEDIFPLVSNMGLKGVVFFDMGNVWGEEEGYKFSDIRKSVGFGIRWLSPMGPMRIEWGYNLDVKEGEDKSSWNFRIGGYF